MAGALNLDGIPHFLAVAETGSFTAAAARFGVSPSAVSQAVRLLEHRLGTALFNRSTRSVALTEAGARYLELVTPAIAELAAAQDEIGEAAVRPRGKLRIIAQRAAHMMVVQPLLGEFLAAYPEIDVEVVIDFGVNDMVMEGFDAGIRFGDIVEKDMVGIDIGPALSAHVLASPSYLSARDMPAHPNDLLRHDCIGYRVMPSGLIERWEFVKGNERLNLAITGRLIFNDSASLTQAALDGLGITYMINGYVDRFIDQGRLVRLLEPWSPDLARFRLYYPDRRRVPPKLRAFIDFLQRHGRRAKAITEVVLI
jgi:DNA-binding transcriptional LysR family regulator